MRVRCCSTAPPGDRSAVCCAGCNARASRAAVKFERYIRNATKRHKVKRGLRWPRFSRLPMEILQMIAGYVAVPASHENGHSTISTDLFKMRQVCKTFAAAGSFEFRCLLQSEKHNEYRILNLPCRSSLDSLRKMFGHEDTLMSGIVTSVAYNITSSQTPDLDLQFIGEMLMDRDDSCCDCSSRHICCSGTMLDQRVARYNALILEQNDFAKELGSPSGMKRLRDTLSSLPKAKTISIQIADYWNDVSSFWDLSSEDDHVAEAAYQTGIPAILECLSASHAKVLEFSGAGSFALGGLHPLTMMKLSRKKNFLHDIVNLKLNMTHKDNVDSPGDGEPVLMALSRGDRLCLLINCMKNLRSLSLEYTDVGYYDYVETYADRKWLADVLAGQTWKDLKHFTLKNFYANVRSLVPFLKQHAKTLETIDLDGLNMPDKDWLTVLNLLRDQCTLKKASLKLRDTRTSPALTKIVADHNVQKNMGPGDLAEVGGYVVKNVREVIELE